MTPAEISRSCLRSWRTLVASVAGATSTESWALLQVTNSAWPGHWQLWSGHKNDLAKDSKHPVVLMKRPSGRGSFWATFHYLQQFCQLRTDRAGHRSVLCGTFAPLLAPWQGFLSAVVTLAGSCGAGVSCTGLLVSQCLLLGRLAMVQRCTFFSIERELTSVFCL